MAKTIVVIEPDEAISELFRLVFGEEGYDVVSVASLDEAAPVLSRDDADLIITEAFDQPSCFTFDPAFLTRLKRMAGKTPIILCSIDASTETLRPSDYGLAGNLPKPFPLDKLLTLVQQLIGPA
jgi:DNA-binding NtrC family response regulator